MRFYLTIKWVAMCLNIKIGKILEQLFLTADFQKLIHNQIKQNRRNNEKVKNRIKA